VFLLAQELLTVELVSQLAQQAGTKPPLHGPPHLSLFANYAQQVVQHAEPVVLAQHAMQDMSSSTQAVLLALPIAHHAHPQPPALTAQDQLSLKSTDLQLECAFLLATHHLLPMETHQHHTVLHAKETALHAPAQSSAHHALMDINYHHQ
jgi:hypothetical protein